MAASYRIRSILAAGQPAETDGGHRAFDQREAWSARARGGRARPTLAAMEEDVTECVRTVERAVANLAALTENCDYFRDMADDFRDELEAEKAEYKAARRQLVELERGVRTERERAERAEDQAVKRELAIEELRRELDAVRAQTLRLVGVVANLIPADEAPDIHEAYDRLVA